MTEELNISDMTDEQLVDLIIQEHGEKCANELIKRYIPIVRIKATKMAMRCSSADKDDLFSEGLMGLLKAVRLYNGEKGASFATFANLCVDSAMKTCISKAIKVNPILTDEDFDFDLIRDDSLSTEDAVVDKVGDIQFMKRLSCVLSEKEMKVLDMYLKHCSYEQIASELSMNEKSVDNALQRAKSKIRKAMGK